jgi:molybdopterin synthase sulfur carrier subunit
VASPIAQVPDEPGSLQVTVRYFAAARAAAGADSETVTLRPGTTVAELVKSLAGHGECLATVLSRCSYLRDGIAVRDETITLGSGDTIDVLPPFAGG